MGTVVVETFIARPPEMALILPLIDRTAHKDLPVEFANLKKVLEAGGSI